MHLDRTEAVIPKILSQIWIGPHPPPERWMSTWSLAHPTWEYRVWTEREIRSLKMPPAAKVVYRRAYDMGLYDAAADVARFAILNLHGGVYVDADSVCLRPLDGAPFLDAGFFAVQEITWVPDLVSDAFMGAVAGHGVLRRYLDAMSEVRGLTATGGGAPWIKTGPKLLTRILKRSRENDIVIAPMWAFYTTTLWGEEVEGPPGYARHMWGSTASRSDIAAATPYPA